MVTYLDANAAKRLVHEPREIAVLDVREHGQYGEGHPLLAVSCPYSRLELLAPLLVPNVRVSLLLLDAGDGTAERASQRLATLGYERISILDGGTVAWEANGYTLFKGVNVPSKVLGELAEETWHPTTIDPHTLADWQEQGRSFLLVDTRPPVEHRKMTIPGARCVPNGEFLHRFDMLVRDETTPIVLTCAGRTRGIVGAVGLAVGGVCNPVYALRNGTQGWTLTGRELAQGQSPAPMPELDVGQSERSRERARTLAQRASIPFIDETALRRLFEDSERTLFLLDVRTAEEFARGHVLGSVHAPGVQLVQATDQWIGVRRARLVLIDDTGLRATVAAFWLVQLGYEVYILANVSEREVPHHWLGKRPTPGAYKRSPFASASPAASFAASSRGEAMLLDLRSSMAHRRQRAMGARWAIRPKLKQALRGHRGSVHLMADTDVGALSAIDLYEYGVAEVRQIEGGMDGWREAGLPTEAISAEPSDAAAIDHLFFVHDRHDGNLDAAREYLAWETQLITQLDRAERAEFRLRR